MGQEDKEDKEEPAQNEQIQYPYFTFENEMYANCMIKFLSKLVIRIFKPNFLMAEEMDECMEILFVEKGFYKVGYEINNK